MYWGGEKLSYLRYLTIVSLQKQNPDWRICVYVPTTVYSGDIKWVSLAHVIKYRGPDYFDAMLHLDIDVVHVDFDKIGFLNNRPEPYKSDYLQWYILYRQGGFWSDTDVIYYKPLPDFSDWDIVATADLFTSVYYIAYMYANPNTSVFKTLSTMAKSSLDFKNYQAYGNILFRQACGKCEDLVFFNPDLKIKIERPEITLPVKCIRDIKTIYESEKVDCSESIGLHWFGGHPLSGRWENILVDEKSVMEHDNVLCRRIIGAIR